MKILIYLLLASLLFAGCLGGEPKVTAIDYPTEPENQAISAPEKTDESLDPTEPDKPVSEPLEKVDIFTSPWGDECDGFGDCGSSRDMKDCVKGHCVDVECKFKEDCTNADHCFNGKCYLESQLYAEFSKCGPDIGCQGKCENCKDGKRTCLVTGWSEEHKSMDYYLCVECQLDHDCNEGYSCEQHYCIRN